jgi:uncharacterized delta-60 repeat protein
MIRLDSKGAWLNSNMIAVDPGGKLVHAGSYSGKILVSRFDADGVLDENFGTAGQLDLDLPGTGEYATALLVRADSSMFLAGNVTNTNTDAFVALITAGGALDPSFSGGVVTLDIGNFDIATALLESDGILVAGQAGVDGFIAKYTTAGIPDSAFDSDGLLKPVPNSVSPVDCGVTRPRALFALGPDILFVGAGNDSTCSVLVQKLDAAGVQDTSFGTDGFAKPFASTPGFKLEDATFGSEGLIVVGSLDSNFSVAVVNAESWSLDTTFSSDGTSSLDFYPSTVAVPQSESAYGVTRDASGNIIVVGGGSPKQRGSIAAFLPPVPN